MTVSKRKFWRQSGLSHEEYVWYGRRLPIRTKDGKLWFLLGEQEVSILHQLEYDVEISESLHSPLMFVAFTEETIPVLRRMDTILACLNKE